MYRSDAKVLRTCKKMQSIEGDYIVICDNNEIRHCRGLEDVERALKKENGIKLKMESTSFDACINNLLNTGMLKRKGFSSVYQVTHDGWNQHEVIFYQRAEFLMTHALFPSFVSIATTLIVHFVIALIG